MLLQPSDFPPISVTVPVSHDITSHPLFGQLPLVHDPSRLYPPQRRSPHPPSPLATGGGHSRSLSPTGKLVRTFLNKIKKNMKDDSVHISIYSTEKIL